MTINVSFDNNELRVVCSSWSAFVAFAREIRVDVADITNAQVLPVKEVRKLMGWRTRGTYIPRRVAAGWFAVPGRRGARQWWATFRATDVLVVTTNQDRPARIVVETPQAEELAIAITARVSP